MNEADIAAVMEELEEEQLLKIFRILPKDLAADVFAYMDVDNQQFIITSLSERDAANIIDNLMADDATDLLEEMPASIVKKLLAIASPETRRAINQLLRYPEDCAGSIMTVEFVDLKENLTVTESIERIRNLGLDSENINNCYVLDTRRKLVGTVTLRSLLLSREDAVIGDIMEENVIAVNTMMDQEKVARQFQKYDFTAMPVVDQENRLVGIITVDDIVDILEQEATEDIEKMAAIVPSDKPYMKTGILETWKKRIPWLLMMISATFTERIIASFENALSTCVEKGFLDFFKEADADFVCIQESKLQEGRVITLEYEDYYVITVYTPNSQDGLKRLDYRMKWEADFCAYLKKLEEKKPVIFCGDLNVAHKEIDLKNPKTNRKNAGFTDEERACMDHLQEVGFIDTFRYFYPDRAEIYSWWSYRFQARAKNAGWRIDYFLVSEALKDRLKGAEILTEVYGSDHCPVLLEIE